MVDKVEVKYGLIFHFTKNLLIITIEDALHIDDAQWLTIKKGGVVRIFL